MNSINLFDNLKIHKVDLSDSHIRKINLVSQEGFIEIKINEDSDPELVLFSDELSSRSIYLNSKLYELDLASIENSGDRLELNQNDKRIKHRYIIEFNQVDKLNEFKELIRNLSDIFNLFFKIKPMTSHEEMSTNEPQEQGVNIKEICSELEKSIHSGNIEKSSFYAQELAKCAVKIEILIKEKGVDNENKDFIELSKVKIMIYQAEDQNPKFSELILPTKEFKIVDLKMQIEASFKIPPSDQILILNDFNPNDNDFLEDYRVTRPSTSAQADSANDFNVSVYIKNQNLHIQDLINAKDKETDDSNFMQDNIDQLTAYYTQDINENIEPFDCDICLETNLGPSKGVILKECLHVFCKDCLANYINNSDPMIKCPYSKDYTCEYSLQDREIRALVSEEDFAKYQLKSLKISEASMQNTVHCKTPDCFGFCICEDDLNFFECQVCTKVNCLRCNVIHMGQTCKEYQDDLKIKALDDVNAKKNKEALEKLIANRKAMYCPGCKIILCKQEGCDWLQCPCCKVEICWATRGPRWGPKGHGDTSGGCKCNIDNKLCHPNCGNCH